MTLNNCARYLKRARTSRGESAERSAIVGDCSMRFTIGRSDLRIYAQNDYYIGFLDGELVCSAANEALLVAELIEATRTKIRGGTSPRRSAVCLDDGHDTLSLTTAGVLGRGGPK